MTDLSESSPITSALLWSRDPAMERGNVRAGGTGKMGTLCVLLSILL